MAGFDRIFTLPERQYRAESPVILEKGALLKDNDDGSLLAQLKFLSVSDKVITSLKVSVTCFDPAGKELGSEEHFYLDLAVKRGDFFGSQEAIPLPDPTTRSFSAKVVEAVLKDGFVWKNSEAFDKTLPKQTLLDTKYKAGYAHAFGSRAAFVPEAGETAWLCICGAVNLEREAKCFSCGAERDALFRADAEILRGRLGERYETLRLLLTDALENPNLHIREFDSPALD